MGTIISKPVLRDHRHAVIPNRSGDPDAGEGRGAGWVSRTGRLRWYGPKVMMAAEPPWHSIHILDSIGGHCEVLSHSDSSLH
jgi:hypothetical protein